MREGERALIHVPPGLGYGPAAGDVGDFCCAVVLCIVRDRLRRPPRYGPSPQGKKGGAWYIPANSKLLFDIEILGKAGAEL